jgi:hypothetical protein
MKGRYFLILPIIIYGVYELFMFCPIAFYVLLSLYFIFGLLIYGIRTNAREEILSDDILINRYYKLRKGKDHRDYDGRHSNSFYRTYKLCIFKSIKNEPTLFFKIPLILPVIIIGLYKGLEEVLNYLDRHLSIFTDE